MLAATARPPAPPNRPRPSQPKAARLAVLPSGRAVFGRIHAHRWTFAGHGLPVPLLVPPIFGCCRFALTLGLHARGWPLRRCAVCSCDSCCCCSGCDFWFSFCCGFCCGGSRMRIAFRGAPSRPSLAPSPVPDRAATTALRRLSVPALAASQRLLHRGVRLAALPRQPRTAASGPASLLAPLRDWPFDRSLRRRHQ